MKLERFDIAVVGAGIAGASFAYYAAPHARIVVLERESHPAMHATGRSAAMFIESYGPPQVRALTAASRAFLERPPDGFATVPLMTPRGALYIGSAEQCDAVDALEAALNASGRRALRVSSADAIARVPALRAEAAVHALLDSDACDIDVDALHQGFLRGARANGACVVCDAGVRGLSHDAGSGWRLDTDAGAFRADIVVNAAGAWVDEVGALAGASPIGIEPRRRSAFTFAPGEHDVRGWPLVCGIDESFYFKPDAGVLLGSPANADPVVPHDVVPEELDIATGIARIEEATTLRIRRPLRVWAGLRSFVASGELVGDFDPALPPFFRVAGQGGYGIQTSVAMGAACAALVLRRPMPAWVADAGLAPGALSLPHQRRPAM